MKRDFSYDYGILFMSKWNAKNGLKFLQDFSFHFENNTIKQRINEIYKRKKQVQITSRYVHDKIDFPFIFILS